ncbi:hypothetical protein PENTCL1PPCAC_19832, partial [Pristionchus entomophagus]
VLFQTMSVVYYTYRHPGERPKGQKPVWRWLDLLNYEARRAIAAPSDEIILGTWAPISAFHEPPMKAALVQLTQGMLIEVKLPAYEKKFVEPTNPVWIAECIHMAGYYILARWCGSEKEGEGYFWMHSANAAVHPVGHAEKNKPSYGLIPPSSMVFNKTESEWQDFITEHVLEKYTADDNFDSRGTEINNNKFRAGERVETIYGEESSVLCPAVIKKVIGRRVLLDYSRADIEKSDQIEMHNMWRDMN